MDAVNVIKDMIVVEKAKAIRDHCKGTYCKKCVFYCGVCSLGTFHPCDWDFKDITYGEGEEDVTKKH